MTPVTFDFDVEGTFTNGVSADGKITLTGNNYRYNGGGHGYELGATSPIEIEVDGPVQIKIGGCNHSAATTIALNGVTKDAINNCNDGLTFDYAGEAATLTLSYDANIYIHYITVTPVEATEE